MAQSERDGTRETEAFDLSDEDVDSLWDEIVTCCRRPKLERAMSAWTKLGDDYRGLGNRSST